MGAVYARASATAFKVLGPFTVSGASSPFSSGCNGAPQTGTNYLNAEVEPWVAINPAIPGNIIGVWQQDRWSNGGANGLVAGVSFDGGHNWIYRWAHFSRCAGGNAGNGGNYERASDPWITFAPGGAAYQIAIAFNDSNNNNGVLVSKSTDGGFTWSEPVILKTDTALTVFNDKESITADPATAGYVYAIWDRLVSPSPRARGRSFEKAVGYHGPTWFTRTTNGGVTWETARMIFDPGEQNQTIGNQIVVLPDGTLLDAFDLIYTAKNTGSVRGYNVALMRSTDHGQTWSAPSIVDKLLTVFVTDPNTGEQIRTSDIIPEVAVDPASGNLYLVWQDGRFSGFAHDDIAFAMSTDGGHTWSAAARISNPTAASPTKPSFTPSVHVAADGTVAVTYYDFRSLTAQTSTLPTDYWVVHCQPLAVNCADRANWQENHVAGPFDMKTAPLTDTGYFLGDYEGLTGIGVTFRPLFVQTNSGDTADRTDVFIAAAGP